MPLHVILVAIGSHGDVHPYVGLGRTLMARGHRVTLLASAHFGSLAGKAGVAFHPLGTDEDFRASIGEADLWHPRRGFETVMRLSRPLVWPTYEFIRDHYVGGETVVAGSSLALGARLAEDKLGVPTATVHLSPVVFGSTIAPPRLPGLSWLRWMPAWFVDWFWGAAERWFTDPVVAPWLNEMRRDLGMGPVRSIVLTWINSPRLVIGMFPEWFGPKVPDWPGQVRLTGFPLYDERGLAPMPGELERFLDAGAAPVAFTPGSAMVHGNKFFATAVGACERAGLRGVLLTRHGEQVPGALPASVVHVPFAPFSQLLPRCAAIAHHGGIGTSSQALAAGCPQLVMPMAHDQPDNAERLGRLGVAETLYPRAFTAKNVARALLRLTGEPAVKSACQAVARRFERADGLGETADLIESLAPIPARV